MSETNNDTIFRSLFNLVEWTFDVQLSVADKALFEAEVLRGWSNGDRSDHELIAYMLQLQRTLWKVSATKRARCKPEAREIFRRLFKTRESNDRGRIVAALHGMLESASHGITGVRGAPAVGRAPASSAALPVPHLTLPAVVPASPPSIGTITPSGPLYAGPPVAPAVGTTVGPGYSLPPRINDVSRLQLEQDHELQMVRLKSVMAKRESETIDKIIDNF